MLGAVCFIIRGCPPCGISPPRLGYVTDKAAQSWLPPKYHGQACDSRHQCGQSVNMTLPAPRMLNTGGVRELNTRLEQ